jgi:hypothetical protein
MASLTIFDVPNLEEAVAYAQAQETLSRYPRLREIYDDDFVRSLVARRRGQNYLLFMLVRPGNDFTDPFWAHVSDDLMVLASAGSFERFKTKLRARDRETLEAARSELALAARLRRLGYDVTLEAPTRNGRDCDVVASTTPETYWEIKAVLDLEAIVEDAEVAFDIQARLRRIPEPYILSILESKLARNEVAAAVRDVKRQIAAHYRSDDILPKRFWSNGLQVEASQRTKRPEGYLGSTQFGTKVFGTEHAKKIRSRIVSAIEQLPEDNAGVVVIDTTCASWVEQEDVVDACFGSESTVVFNDQMVNVRDSEVAAFQATQRRRVSAVVHYTRHPRDAGQSLLIIHNPFARIPIPVEVLAADDVQQMVRVAHGTDRYRLERIPAENEQF